MLPMLEDQKLLLEKKMSQSDTDISKTSHELAAIIASIEVYEDRWLELSELLESS